MQIQIHSRNLEHVHHQGILNDKDEQIPISQADAKYKRYIGNGAPKHF